MYPASTGQQPPQQQPQPPPSIRTTRSSAAANAPPSDLSRQQQRGHPAASPPPRTPVISVLHPFPTPTTQPTPPIHPAPSASESASFSFVPHSRSHSHSADPDDDAEQHQSLLHGHQSTRTSDAGVPSAYSSRSGLAMGPDGYIKQRRVGGDSSAASSAAHARDRPLHDAYEGDKAHGTMAGRKIVRVSAARRNRGSWAAEMRSMITSVLGRPRHKDGRINCAFFGKLLLALALLSLLAMWLLSGRGPKVVPVPSTPAHILSAPITHATLLSSAGVRAPQGHSHAPARTQEERSQLTNADVTIFTVYTPEEGHAAGAAAAVAGDTDAPSHNVHLRAIYSWSLRVAHPGLVHVYVRDYSHCVSMQHLGVTCRVSGCWDEEMDAPLLTCMLGEANRRASTELMLYVDDHVILFEDTLPALLRVGRLGRFLMLGRSQPLRLRLDPELDLETWQRDLESALFLDSSSEHRHNQAPAEEHSAASGSQSIHFLAYARRQLDLSVLPPHLLMDEGSSLDTHSWESQFLATMLVQDRVHVVDASGAMTAIEFGHSAEQRTNRTARLNEHNRATTWNFTGVASLRPGDTSAASTVAHLALGRLENAHYVLTGRCPTCILKENREADLPLILLRKADAHRRVVVVTTNADYLSLTFNWICRAQQLGVTNYIFLAEDRVSYRLLRKLDVAAVLRQDAPYRKRAAAPGTKSFQETLYQRALFLHQVVGLGFGVVLSHLDTVWFQNPLQLLAQQQERCDMFVQMEKISGNNPRPSGGILVLRANPVGQAFAQAYLLCEQENWNFIQQHGRSRFSYSDDVDIDCIDLISTRLMRRNGLKRCVLDPTRYVNERDFFDRQLPQRQGVWPYFVHLNQANGVANKTASFQGWHLWAVDDDAMLLSPPSQDAHAHAELHCLAPPPTLPPPEEHQQHPVHIIIHLLCSTEYKGMELTLLSLASTRYDSGVHVDLSITLQQPEVESADNSAAYLKVRQLVERFEWTQGTKTLMVLDTFVGPSDRWIDQWGLRANNDAFLLVLEAGQILSPHWCTWTTQALRQYYFDPFSYDPQLMAISLVHQLSIVGETPSARYGSRVPSRILAAAAEARRAEKTAAAADSNSTTVTTSPLPGDSLPSHHLYLYQLVPLTGSLFFPRHFATFVQWYLAQNKIDRRVPCVPTLVSNKWWLEDPAHQWQTWLTRFTFESGYYALYTNFHSTASAGAKAPTSSAGGSVPVLEGPRALLVDDKPTAGSLVISLLKRPGPSELHFPPRSELDLFDLHFAPFDQDPSLLGRRKLMLPPLPYSTSMRRALELEAALHLQGDLVEDPTGLPTLRPSAAAVAASASAGDPGQQAPELQESDVSHLDVVIEAMIRDMEDRAVVGAGSAAPSRASSRAQGATVEGKPNLAELRAAAELRARRRLSPLHSHRAPHSRPIRGVVLDRCYTVDDAAVEQETAECKDCFRLHPRIRSSIERSIATHTAEINAVHKAARTAAIESGLPPPPPPPPYIHPLQSYLTANVAAEELYNLMYQLARPRLPSATVPFDASNPDSPRFVLYQPSKRGAFDSHLRGISFAFLLALLTNRILLIDLPDLHLQYECPFPDAEWRWTNFSAYLKDAPADVFSSQKSAALRTTSLDTVYTKPLLIHSDMVTQDRVIFKNAMYASASATLFGSSSRMRRTGEIVRLLLSKPRPALLEAVEETRRAVGLSTAKTTLAVHVVVPAAFMTRPITAADPLPGVPERHWDCVRSFLLSQQLVADGAVIYFTTNRPSAHALVLARKEMARFGQVVTHPHSWNASVTTGGVSSAASGSSIARNADGSPVIDPALVSAFIMGEVDVAISSGTTYGIFHSARTAFRQRALIVKLAPPPAKNGASSSEEDYCGPMRRLDLPMQEDITY